MHPHYLILFCNVPPGGGGETSVVSSLALYDRLNKEHPGFIEGCRDKGLVYHIPHTATQVGGIVGGNGLYKASAFGPKDGSAPPDSEEEKRAGVEKRVVELAERGGWKEGDEKNFSKPHWQRRGFDWTWFDNGDLEVVHRVPGKSFWSKVCQPLTLLIRCARAPYQAYRLRVQRECYSISHANHQADGN